MLFKAGNIKMFHTTAETMLKVESGNSVVKSVNFGDQPISEKYRVHQAIAD
jgi:hypothetical protein